MIITYVNRYERVKQYFNLIYYLSHPNRMNEL